MKVRGAAHLQTTAALTVALTLFLALIALLPARAEAGCAICDQYTLDIPDAHNGSSGSGSGGNFGSGSTPSTTPAPDTSTTAPTPATTPVTPATTVPETTTPVTPATTAPDATAPEPDRQHHVKPAPEPLPPPHGIGVDPPKPKGLVSSPLSYDSGSGTGAALDGLATPATIALLAALLAAGAAVGLGYRRSSPAT